MKRKQKQFIIYLCSAWALPFFILLIGIGKVGTFLVWIADNGIDEMNYRIFIPIRDRISDKIKDDE